MERFKGADSQEEAEDHDVIIDGRPAKYAGCDGFTVMYVNSKILIFPNHL